LNQKKFTEAEYLFLFEIICGLAKAKVDLAFSLPSAGEPFFAETDFNN